eukprot:GHVS01037007.1.p1 GENE.GHVS01037007.1~~GHVS01037007.1.p1  ORF type:complete len:480 (+),score=125.87 GHVS01037007.1:112-1551(+)
MATGVTGMLYIGRYILPPIYRQTVYRQTTINKYVNIQTSINTISWNSSSSSCCCSFLSSIESNYINFSSSSLSILPSQTYSIILPSQRSFCSFTPPPLPSVGHNFSEEKQNHSMKYNKSLNFQMSSPPASTPTCPPPPPSTSICPPSPPSPSPPSLSSTSICPSSSSTVGNLSSSTIQSEVLFLPAGDLPPLPYVEPSPFHFDSFLHRVDVLSTTCDGSLVVSPSPLPPLSVAQTFMSAFYSEIHNDDFGEEKGKTTQRASLRAPSAMPRTLSTRQQQQLQQQQQEESLSEQCFHQTQISSTETISDSFQLQKHNNNTNNTLPSYSSSTTSSLSSSSSSSLPVPSPTFPPPVPSSLYPNVPSISAYSSWSPPPSIPSPAAAFATYHVAFPITPFVSESSFFSPYDQNCGALYGNYKLSKDRRRPFIPGRIWMVLVVGFFAIGFALQPWYILLYANRKIKANQNLMLYGNSKSLPQHLRL